MKAPSSPSRSPPAEDRVVIVALSNHPTPARVSARHAAEVLRHCWHGDLRPDGSVYAYAWVRDSGRRRQLWLHRLVTGCPAGMEVHHGDGNTLNNLDGNLRIVTPYEHRRLHRKKPARAAGKGPRSAFPGVSYHPSRRWVGRYTDAEGFRRCKVFPLSPDGELSAALWVALSEELTDPGGRPIAPDLLGKPVPLDVIEAAVNETGEKWVPGLCAALRRLKDGPAGVEVVPTENR